METDPASPEVKAVLDELAPYHDSGGERIRMPIFEWPHESQPTEPEMIGLARDILDRLRRIGWGPLSGAAPE